MAKYRVLATVGGEETRGEIESHAPADAAREHVRRIDKNWELAKSRSPIDVRVVEDNGSSEGAAVYTCRVRGEMFPYYKAELISRVRLT